MTSRHSIATAPPPPLTISPSAIISDKAILSGTHPIAIADDAMIHPFARLDSSRGPIAIGAGALVWERAVVGGVSPKKKPSQGGPRRDTDEAEEDVDEDDILATIVDDGASLETHCHVSCGAKIGAHATVGTNASIGVRARIGAYATVAPYTAVRADERVEEFATVFVLDGRVIKRKGIMRLVPVDKSDGTVQTGDVLREDAVRMKALKDKGQERELGLLKRVVKGGSKWVSA